MKERTRIAALIIQNKKLLLVKGSDEYKEFWAPGGKLEQGETELECLKRELAEELSAKLINAEFFAEYLGKSPYEKDTLTRSRAYLATISGELIPGKEIKRFVWMSKEEYLERKYEITATTRGKIIPDLIKKGLY